MQWLNRAMLRLLIENILDKEEKIMAEWIVTNLEECTDVLGDGLHGTPKYTENGEYAFVNGNNLVDGKILIKKETKRVDYSQYEKYKKPLTDRTIFVSINGTLGNVGVYDSEKIILGKSACYFNVKQSVDKDFIYYVVSSPIFRQYLENNATGTTIKNISLKQMREYTFSIPQIDEQKRISSILRMIDEKIKINKAINNNLEQQAQAIFDSMFPNISNGENTIGDTITPKRGKGLLSKNAVFGNVPVVAGGLEPSTYHNTANTKAPVLAISASGANAGFVSLWNIPIWSSDSSFIDSSMTDDVYFWYVLLKKRQREIYDSQTGSAQPHIYPQHIAAMPISDLNFDYVRNYTSIVTPIFEMIGHNKDENARLATTRDTLLPKLMSGELDVSDIEI